MGARNVSAVFAMWPSLKPGPKVALLWMALKSLDARSAEGRPPRVYYDGEQSLVEALGQSRRSVYNALTALREAGAIEVLEHGRMKHRAVYKLHLDPASSVQPAAPTSVQPSAPKRVQPAAQQGAAECTPMNNEGGTKESREGDISSEVTTSPAAVDDDADPDSTLTDAERTERHNRQLIERHGLIPALRLIEGGKTA